jgi:hypothetical protein
MQHNSTRLQNNQVVWESYRVLMALFSLLLDLDLLITMFWLYLCFYIEESKIGLVKMNLKPYASRPSSLQKYLHIGMKEIFLDVILNHWLFILKSESYRKKSLYLAY